MPLKLPKKRPQFKRLGSIGRRLSIRGGVRRLAGMPGVRHAILVAEPTRQAHHRLLPAQESRQECGEITVLTANLWHDWPRHRRLLERAEAFASQAESSGADILLLQEVARTRKVRLDEWLADRLGMAYVYTRANGHEAIGFEEGVAVLSRFPVEELFFKQLEPSSKPFARRVALGAELSTPCGKMFAFSAHLGLGRRKNSAQLKHLRRWMSEVSGGQPAVLAGDFNAHETTRHIRLARLQWVDTYRHLHPTADATTHELRLLPGKAIRRRLDYIFLQPGAWEWQVLESFPLSQPESRFSDHQAVVAKLWVKSPRPAAGQPEGGS